MDEAKEAILDTASTNTLLQDFQILTLQETAKVRLMHRSDTKYIVRKDMIPWLLERAKTCYFVQVDTAEQRQPLYHTVYYDTPDYRMFYEHVLGRSVRDKVRIREYSDTHSRFLEVKHKDNHGNTDKRRDYPGMHEHLNVPFYDQLVPQIENSFHRITLVSMNMTERVTIDTDIVFHAMQSNNETSLPGLAVIEIKREKLSPSVMHEMLRENHVHPSGFSKYCIGMAMTMSSSGLRLNNLKQKLHTINKICKTL